MELGMIFDGRVGDPNVVDEEPVKKLQHTSRKEWEIFVVPIMTKLPRSLSGETAWTT